MKDINLCMEFYGAVKDRIHCVVPKCKDPNTQFHHIVQADKVSECLRVALTGDLFALIAEFKKCAPVCDKHHKRIHSGWMPGYFVGTLWSGRQTFDDTKVRILTVKYRETIDELRMRALRGENLRGNRSDRIGYNPSREYDHRLVS